MSSADQIPQSVEEEHRLGMHFTSVPSCALCKDAAVAARLSILRNSEDRLKREVEQLKADGHRIHEFHRTEVERLKQELNEQLLKATAALQERDVLRARVAELEESLRKSERRVSELEGPYLRTMRERAEKAEAEVRERQKLLEQAIEGRASALAERNWANERHDEAQAEVARLRESVAELERERGEMNAALRAEVEEGVRLRARVAELEATWPRLRRALEAARPYLSSAAQRLYDGGRGREQRQSAEEALARIDAALTGLTPAPISERERALVAEAKRLRAVLCEEDVALLDAALAPYAEAQGIPPGEIHLSNFSEPLNEEIAAERDEVRLKDLDKANAEIARLRELDEAHALLEEACLREAKLLDEAWEATGVASSIRGHTTLQDVIRELRASRDAALKRAEEADAQVIRVARERDRYRADKSKPEPQYVTREEFEAEIGRLAKPGTERDTWETSISAALAEVQEALAQRDDLGGQRFVVLLKRKS